ncbi:PAS domain-containing sensor histidine kinase [Methanohalobium sp.]|uniref:PAS domain-containing sensor histidine kinase n=1 Tax=Methanohalobium sp. TaxID=2837493 RepID=UPI0025CD610A|nr:PAS domain-containing sensor histidine kinase [Methanohalobium sp.]
MEKDDEKSKDQLLQEIKELRNQNSNLQKHLTESHSNDNQASTLISDDIIDFIPDILGIQDTNHNIIKYNKAGYSFFNLKPEEVAGKKCYEMIGRNKPCEICATSKVYKSKKPEHVVKYIEEMDIWFDVRAYPIFDSNGNLTNVMEHLRDITQEKKLENKIKDQRNDLEKIVYERTKQLEFERDRAQKYLDISGAIIIVLDNNQRIELINNKGCEVLGYDKSELIGKNMYENFVPREYMKQVNNVSNNLIQGYEDNNNFINPIIGKNGEERIISWYNSVLKDDEGSIIGTLSSGIDVTEIINLKNSLQESKKQYKQLFEESPVGLLKCKSNGKIVDVNKRILEILNSSSKEETLKFNLLESPYIKNSGFDEELRKTFSNNRVVKNERKYLSFWGRKGWIYYKIVPLGDEEGNVNEAIIALDDITQRKETETQLLKYYDNLQKANRELKSLSDMKNRFISNVSHELRTPITNIKGYSNLLSNKKLGELNDKQSKAVSVISQSCERLRWLIDTLIHINTLEPDNGIQHTQKISLSSLLNDVVSENSVYFFDKGINLTTNIDSNLPLVDANPEYLEQVFVHILDNACKFTPSGGKVDVHTFDDGNFHIIVSDNGIGIDEESTNNIFDLFYQKDDSSKRRYSGTGAGMYFCKKIIEKHHGNIWVESKIKEGTDVHIILPKIS